MWPVICGRIAGRAGWARAWNLPTIATTLVATSPSHRLEYLRPSRPPHDETSYEEEDDLEVTILIDASRSMRWMALRRVRLEPMAARRSGGCRADRISAFRAWIVWAWVISTLRRAGKRSLSRTQVLCRCCVFGESSFAGEGGTDPRKVLGRSRAETRRRGLAIVLSDCLDPAGFERGLSMVTNRHFALHLVHLLHPQECAPARKEDLWCGIANQGGIAGHREIRL